MRSYINTNFRFEQIDSLNSQHSYLEKQIGSLEAASQPKKDELDQLRKLDSIISAEENKIDELIQGSKQLKEKVRNSFINFFLASSSFIMLSN